MFGQWFTSTYLSQNRWMLYLYGYTSFIKQTRDDYFYLEIKYGNTWVIDGILYKTLERAKNAARQTCEQSSLSRLHESYAQPISDFLPNNYVKSHFPSDVD